MADYDSKTRTDSKIRTEGSHTFRCADVGNSDCRFEVSGEREEDLLPIAEAHGRTHGQNWEHPKILDAIRQRRAA